MNSIEEKPYVIPGDKWFPKETSFEDDMPLYWGNWGVSSEVDDLKAVLMRRPEKEIEHFDHDVVRYRDNVDVELFRKQHDTLAQIYKDYGVKVYYVEEQRDDRPNAVYCRDLMFMTPEGAIITRPGMAARRGEERYVAQALAKLGVPILRTINGDGIFEGANAMWVDRKTVILATSSRTNKSGYEQVEYELKRMGVDNIIHMQIPSSNIHIDGLLNFASNDVAMLHASQVPYDVCNALRKKGIKLLEAPSTKEVVDTLGCNFVAIKPGVIVQAANNPMCKKLLEDNGIKVISAEMSEFLKGRGTVHCSTAFLKRG
nr:arginine deiminase family protein [Sedimentibacter sp.]